MAAQSEKRTINAILDAVSEGVFTVDKSWRITNFNRAAEIITGIEAQAAIGKKCSEVFHADICERGCALRQSMDTGENLHGVSARILNAKGQSIPVSVNTALVKDRNGKTVNAIETFTDISHLELLRHEMEQRYFFGDLVGKSKPFGKILASLPEVAQSDSSVLLEGAVGTGKELVARTIHNLSSRHKMPFVSINCEALPANIVEADLFGYAQGATLDKKNHKPGKLTLSKGGTIYLDGIDKLSQTTQVKLLRVLQDREYEPLGSTQTMRTDIRIMASARVKLSELVTCGQFRDDLYFRLAVVHLFLPPLQERRMDIPLLVKHFIQTFNAHLGKNIEGVEPDVTKLLMEYDFPGNIGELRDLVEHACTLCETKSISSKDLPTDFRLKLARKMHRRGQGRADSSHEGSIREAIRQADGHLGHAAQLLGISRTTLWRKMKRLGLSTGDVK